MAEGSPPMRRRRISATPSARGYLACHWRLSSSRRQNVLAYRFQLFLVSDDAIVVISMPELSLIPGPAFFNDATPPSGGDLVLERGDHESDGVAGGFIGIRSRHDDPVEVIGHDNAINQDDVREPLGKALPDLMYTAALWRQPHLPFCDASE